MQFRTKRVLAFATVASYLFLTGLENAIILPTAWRYLMFLGANQEYLLGVTVSGFSASAAIAGLIGGRLADSFPSKTKNIVVTAVLAMILGNTMYLIGGSVVYVIMGRVLCGLGSGAGAALLAEVCRTTSSRERTSVLSVCSGLRQVGLLIGPGFQIILEYFNFTLFGGALVVQPFNAPGLFMAVLWICFLMFVLALYQNLDVEYKYEMLRKEHNGLDVRESMDGHSIELSTSRETILAQEDDQPSIAARRWYFIEENFNRETAPHPATYSTYINEFLHDDTVVLFGMTAILFFGQVSIETIIPPLFSRLFDYTSFETSLVYMVGGGFSIAIYLLVSVTTKWTTDTYLVLFGWLMHILGFTWCLIWLPRIQPGDTDKMPVLLIGVMFLYVGFPVAAVGTTSLLSKCVSLRVQGIAQGFRRLATFSGLILGPLWGGATLHKPDLQLSVPLLLLLILGAMFSFSFKKIRNEERIAMNVSK
ncbi:uncharacterized protein LOC130698432 [Daphnia carinata]|uniref:uncharacterized protein LOC130698432 n=1 Tax=Daphnia carinata TaxID=120202 RepID=UPI00257D4B0C|nr:uncharacterized protein LOC130698432 [Daphnia carinata]